VQVGSADAAVGDAELRLAASGGNRNTLAQGNCLVSFVKCRAPGKLRFDQDVRSSAFAGGSAPASYGSTRKSHAKNPATAVSAPGA
jgi:hypothetical protein